ncbi:carbohydrate-binding protein CbpC [Streptomyces chumphonensis]|uniref:Lytic polysaccharide monooxygenase n=1 Tax=Streptomyces chumphonensis TaxID=1214925 RepID=A0A927EY22_9ACTN|nr:lytic polysaccharide monooxygenase [Streptomyces chumphonensis]MBD3931490.1 lytic polysaccharide monooxygenase [Streptomyces chumphonensis]
MTARRSRKAAALTVLGVAPLALTGLTATPALAHGSMSDPVSRVAACYAEGPESPDSAACRAAVAAGGTQPFYDWNEVNIGDAAGRHREIIPDGELCSAGREKYLGLDLPRADWPATALNSGERTFRYTATAPHRGSIELYVTRDGYDPTQPLTWADLEPEPFVAVTDPKLSEGAYVFTGDVPEKSGRHLIYSVWQRSDSPEAFYTCSDVTFGGESAPAGEPGAEEPGAGAEEAAAETEAPAAPTREQIEEGRDRSSVSHDGHGGDGPDAPEHSGHSKDEGPEPLGDGTEPVGQRDEAHLAETGGEDATGTLAVGGAAALALGTGVVALTLRRRALGRHRA